MICPKCNSEDVNVQVVSEQKIEKAGHGCLWWCLIGWWLVPGLWLFATLPMLVLKMFGVGKKKITTSHKTKCICQSCGHTWDA